MEAAFGGECLGLDLGAARGHTTPKTLHKIFLVSSLSFLPRASITISLNTLTHFGLTHSARRPHSYALVVPRPLTSHRQLSLSDPVSFALL